MSDKKLRENLVRLAYTKPELRAHLLPLIAQYPGEEEVAPDPLVYGTVYGALTFTSGLLLDLGMEVEATLLTKMKMKVQRQAPEARSLGIAVARNMHKRFGIQ